MLVKANAIDLLRRELARKRIKGLIGAGSMNDPYMPLERTVRLTGRALEVIAEFGFPVHVLQFVEDTPENVFEIITRAKDAGATHVVAAFGMTLRDRQRATYYDQLDRRFPGLRQRYKQAFGGRYHASASGSTRLKAIYVDMTDRLGLQRTVARCRA